MSEPGIHRTRHAVHIAAPPDLVYQLVADTSGWPHTFSPTVHVRRLDGDDHAELLQIWAFAGDEVRTWTSRRQLDPQARRVRFRQEVTSPPVTALGGEWRIDGDGDGGTEVVFHHDFFVRDDDPAQVAWVNVAIERNTTAELDALRVAAELGAAREELVLSFTDAVSVRGSARDAYDFIYRADTWEQRLPHVARLAFTEDTAGIQTIDMDTRAADGTVHTTRSVRICLPDDIVYKQTTVPPIMSAHIGRWEFREDDGVVRVSSQHTVVLRPEKLTELLGPEATVAQAREAVRAALGANSRATLTLAKEAVEATHV
ncbi:Granaticin polyketide synthase bifunctional cyclase/dehydratase [Frankia sp. AiPs1]|uniref:aromatase/cyclase n=1 Tax=Frankia sp. AiPa1 TaxID=573492 RepID=UPI00202B21C1|nr:aromatase/cyclase [Frankia sp. AiPa1]MCL9760511.1 aromatase/cyclase [Frankia sp. AiPa1]